MQQDSTIATPTQTNVTAQKPTWNRQDLFKHEAEGGVVLTLPLEGGWGLELDGDAVRLAGSDAKLSYQALVDLLKGHASEAAPKL